MTGRVLLIGGPGNISTGTIEVLSAAGWTVTVLTRPKQPEPGLELRYVWGDRDDDDAVRAAVDAARPDVVIDTCAFAPDQVSRMIDLLAGRVSQYVFVSTVDVFGHPLSRLPIRESDEHRPPNTVYARAKLECERLVLEAVGAGRLGATVVRPGYSIGERFLIGFFSHLGGRTMLRRLRQGRPIVVPGDGTTLIQPGVGIDTGRLLARVVGEPRSLGNVYTCAGPQVFTHDEYVGAMAAVVGAQPQLVHVPSDLMLSMGDAAVDGGILPGLTRFDLAYSNDAILALGGPIEPSVSLSGAIERHLAWLEDHGWPDVDDGPDDRIAARYGRARSAFLEPVA